MKKRFSTPYLAFFQLSFKQNTVYRVDWLLGVLNTFLQIFISVAIWKALYNGNTEVNGVQFKEVVTNFILAMGLSNIFMFNANHVQRKINDGSIATELMKPVDYRKILLAETLGQVIFNLLVKFFPTLIVCSLCFGILPPKSFICFCLFLVSILMGFLIIWYLNMIVEMTAFWVINVWSINTIKNVFVRVLSGAALPLAFMPVFITRISRFAPFDAIYHIPLQIYLGYADPMQILFCFGKQILWILVFSISSLLLWKSGCKKVIVQGG